jgi:predicted transcriptional regulator
MKRALFFTVLFTFLSVALAAPVSALPHGYLIEPAFGATGYAAPDVVPITFWDLTLREMVIIAALAISPLLVFPVEIFFALKLLSCFGFRRIARGNILDSTIRNTIFCLIRSRPGISFLELLQETAISRGALTYHLALMRITGKIILLEDHGITSYFENSGKYNPGEQKLLKYLRQDTDRQILLTLARRPMMSRRDFEKILGISGPTITWHMRRLIEDELLTLHKVGKFSRYELSSRTRSCLEKYGLGIIGPEAGAGTRDWYPRSGMTSEM